MPALQASAFVLHLIIETENFVVGTGKLMTMVGPSGSGSGQSIERCETYGDHFFSHFEAIGTDKILVFKTNTLNQAEQYTPQANI